MALSDDFLDRKEAAKFLRALGVGVGNNTMRHWARKRVGPPYTLTRSCIARYKKTDLETWAEANTRRVE